MSLGEATETQTAGKRLFSLAKDHFELASLELEYAKKNWWRRLLVRGGGVTFLFSSYIFFHVAVIGALMNVGVNLAWIGLGFGLFYAALGLGVFWFDKRRMDAADPWQGTREELKRSAAWIEQHFF